METEPLQPSKLRIAMTGSSGLVGTSVREYLASKGHDLVRVVRRAPESGGNEVHWRPRDGAIDASGLEGVDAVVHLAGESIFGRWTEAKKQRIVESRRQGTELISRTAAKLQKRPRVLVSASAVGYYGNTGDRRVDEGDEPNDGFLAEVCRTWEKAAGPAREAGIRTVHLRVGLVLSSRGGALKMMRTPFWLGLGGRLGSGKQYMSWIHMEDLVRVIELAIHDNGLIGPVNAVAPEPVTNREFTSTLGKVLHRPTFIPMPAWTLKIALGEMAEEVLLSGQRVEPKKLEDHGFEFVYPQLTSALRRELG